ncbi:MAG: hypothetical protein WDA28_12805 [Castellaniella sp.]
MADTDNIDSSGVVEHAPMINCFGKNCRLKTENVDVEDYVMKNGGIGRRARCAVCGGKKHVIVRGPKTGRAGARGLAKLAAKQATVDGDGVFNTMLNKLPMPEMHMVDMSRGWPRKHSFTGPYTKLHKRLDENDQPLPHSKPINRVDQSAYHHDLAYRDHSDTASRHVADRKMLADMDAIIADPSTGFHERAQARTVKGLIGSKVRFGMGGAKPAVKKRAKK